jgi:hypothetical protein
MGLREMKNLLLGALATLSLGAVAVSLYVASTASFASGMGLLLDGHA